MSRCAELLTVATVEKVNCEWRLMAITHNIDGLYRAVQETTWAKWLSWSSKATCREQLIRAQTKERGRRAALAAELCDKLLASTLLKSQPRSCTLNTASVCKEHGIEDDKGCERKLFAERCLYPKHILDSLLAKKWKAWRQIKDTIIYSRRRKGEQRSIVAFQKAPQDQCK